MINRFSAGIIDENPLMVYRSLANEIGLNEAIIIQQIHFWLRESKHERDGFKWIYNTYAGWEKQFSFWSSATIRRTIGKLEENKLLLSTSEYNKMKIDNTKWYRIDYEELEKRMSRPPAQNEQTDCSNCASVSDQNEQANNQREPKRTSKRTLKDIVVQQVELSVPHEKDKLIEKVITYLNEKTGKRYSPSTKETIKLIGGRITQGADFETFKHVIDVKCNEWLNDPYWKKFLRPSTLFAESNFEDYKQEELTIVTPKPAGQSKDQRTNNVLQDEMRKEMGDVGTRTRHNAAESHSGLLLDV